MNQRIKRNQKAALKMVRSPDSSSPVKSPNSSGDELDQILEGTIKVARQKHAEDMERFHTKGEDKDLNLKRRLEYDSYDDKDAYLKNVKSASSSSSSSLSLPPPVPRRSKRKRTSRY